MFNDNKNDYHQQKEHKKLHIRLLKTVFLFFKQLRFRVIFVLYVKIEPKLHNKNWVLA